MLCRVGIVCSLFLFLSSMVFNSILFSNAQPQQFDGESSKRLPISALSNDDGDFLMNPEQEGTQIKHSHQPTLNPSFSPMPSSGEETIKSNTDSVTLSPSKAIEEPQSSIAPSELPTLSPSLYISPIAIDSHTAQPSSELIPVNSNNTTTKVVPIDNTTIPVPLHNSSSILPLNETTASTFPPNATVNNNNASAVIQVAPVNITTSTSASVNVPEPSISHNISKPNSAQNTTTASESKTISITVVPSSTPTNAPSTTSSSSSLPVSNTPEPSLTPSLRPSLSVTNNSNNNNNQIDRKTNDDDSMMLKPEEEGNQLIHSKPPSLSPTATVASFSSLPTTTKEIPSSKPTARPFAHTVSPNLSTQPSSRPSKSPTSTVKPPQPSSVPGEDEKKNDTTDNNNNNDNNNPNNTKNDQENQPTVAPSRRKKSSSYRPSASAGLETTMVPTIMATLAMTTLVPSIAAQPIVDSSPTIDTGNNNAEPDVSSEETSGFFDTPYLFTAIVFVIGVVALYLFYHFLIGGGRNRTSGANNASGNKGSYSPLPQIEGDLEMASATRSTGNNDDGWDDWEEQHQQSQPPPAVKSKSPSSLASALTNVVSSSASFLSRSSVTDGQTSNKPSRNVPPKRVKKKKPVVNMDAWDDDLDLGSADEEEDEEAMDEEDEDEVEAATENDSFLRKDNQHRKSSPQVDKKPAASSRTNSQSNLSRSGLSSGSGSARSKSPNVQDTGSGNNSLSNSRHGAVSSPAAVSPVHVHSAMDILYGGGDTFRVPDVTAAAAPAVTPRMGSLGSLQKASSSSSKANTAVKKSNKYQLPEQDVDLFASIGIAAAPKIKEPGLPDIDKLFGSMASAPVARSTISNNSNSNSNKVQKTTKSNANKNNKPTTGNSTGRLSTALAATESNHVDEWDEDKELDALIGDD